MDASALDREISILEIRSESLDAWLLLWIAFVVVGLIVEVFVFLKEHFHRVGYTGRPAGLSGIVEVIFQGANVRDEALAKALVQALKHVELKVDGPDPYPPVLGMEMQGAGRFGIPLPPNAPPTGRDRYRQ